MRSRLIRTPYGPRPAYFGFDDFTQQDLSVLSQGAPPSDAPPVSSSFSAGVMDATSGSSDVGGYLSLAQPNPTNFGPAPAPAPAPSSGIADLTKGILGIVSAGGQIANTALQNQTISSILASRGLVAPPPAAPASGPGLGTLLVLGLAGLAIYGATR